MSIISDYWFSSQAGGPGPVPPDPGTAIGHSLRFRGKGNNLHRTQTAGNRRTFTYSVWFKKTNSGGDPSQGGAGWFECLAEAGQTTTRTDLRLEDDVMRTYNVVGGNVNLNLTCAPLLRDPSAWYHIVWSFDTTQATPADRIRFFINGEQQTITGGMFDQNTELRFCQDGQFFGIGDLGPFPNSEARNQLNGYLADVHFIDGQALEPTSFGRENNQGVWVPREVDFSSADLSSNVAVSTGGFAAPATLIFDGNVDSGAVADTSDAVMTFSPGRVPVNGDIELRLGTDNVNATVTWNGLTYNWTAGGGTRQVAFANATGTINGVTPLVITPAAGTALAWNAIWVNGTMLQDGGGYGANGFHLDFSDPDDLGADRSGNGNDFTPTGFDTAPVGIFSNDLTTNTSFSNADPRTHVFDGNTGTVCDAVGQGGVTTRITFAPATPIQVLQLEVRNGVIADQQSIFGGVTTQNLATSQWVNIPLGTATELSAASPLVIERQQQSGSVQIAAIRVNGTMVLVDNTGENYDLMQDSPTQNWSVLNPLIDDSQLEDANLRLVSQTTTRASASSTATWNTTLDANHYYCEFTCIAQAPAGSGPSNIYGVCQRDQPDWFTPNAHQLLGSFSYSGDGRLFIGNTPQGAQGSVPRVEAGDVVGVLYNSNNRQVVFFHNNVEVGTLGNLGAFQDYVFVCGQDGPSTNINQIAANFGQRPFRFAVPQIDGRAAEPLQTQNLQGTAPIPNGRDHFRAITGPGNGNDGTPVAGQRAGNWSRYLTTENPAGFNADAPASNAFDGATNTNAASGGFNASGDPWLMTFAPGETVDFTSTLEVWTGNNDQTAEINGVTTSLTQDAWTSIATGSGEISASTPLLIKGSKAASTSAWLNAVRVDNEILVDFSILASAQRTFPNSLIWIKDRVNSNQHQLVDSVRGGNLALPLPPGNAETAYVPPAGSSVAWCWNVNGAAAANGNGSIASQVAANTAAGFSIVTYTGNGGGNAATIGHGLGAIPEFMLVKTTNATTQWSVYHVSVGNDRRLVLNESDPQTSPDSIYWNSTTPTTDVFSVGSVSNPDPAAPFVAYCWAPVPGYSAFGSYVGNGDPDGAFIYTGMKVAWLMVKATGLSQSWVIADSTRDPINPVSLTINADQPGEEIDFDRWDFLSNGFKARSGANASNASGQTYIYAAFAENPFQAPANAR